MRRYRATLCEVNGAFAMTNPGNVAPLATTLDALTGRAAAVSSFVLPKLRETECWIEKRHARTCAGLVSLIFIVCVLSYGLAHLLPRKA